MNRWSKTRVLDRVFEYLQREQIVPIKLEAVSMDSTIVKVQFEGTGRKRTARSPSWMGRARGETSMSMTWKQFERYCEGLIYETLGTEKYRIRPQYKGEYGGVIKVMDFHIAERRQGGRGFVVDCKHFTKVPLNRKEVDTTEEYRRLSRASGAIILVSSISDCPKSFINYANDMRVKIIEVDIGWRTRIPLLRNYLRRELALGLPDF